jgi:hypothetical protein
MTYSFVDPHDQARHDVTPERMMYAASISAGTARRVRARRICTDCLHGHSNVMLCTVESCTGRCAVATRADCAYCPLGIVPGGAVMLEGYPAHPECAKACAGLDLAEIRRSISEMFA